jgi:hypothetical protein
MNEKITQLPAGIKECNIMKDLPICCERNLMPLPHIPVKVVKRKGGDYNNDSHYYNYAFECLYCGAVYEIIVEHYTYESIGDFMCPNTTEWSTRPALRQIDTDICKSINDNYEKQISKLTNEACEIQERIKKEVPSLDSLSAREKLRESLNSRRRDIDKSIKSLGAQKKAEIRNVLGLPQITKEYREGRYTRKYDVEKLKEKLEANRRDLASVDALITKINSRDKLLSSIRKIEKEVQNLESLTTECLPEAIYATS